MVLIRGSHAIRSTSTLQNVVALSSGEAEFYGFTKVASASLGVQAYFGDLGTSVDLVLLTDSSAAKGLSGRLGLGASRHMSCRYLWLQERVAAGDIALATVPTAKNVSDLLTKVLARPDAQRHMETMGIVVVARGGAQKGLA